jgi:hypothetical protein
VLSRCGKWQRGRSVPCADGSGDHLSGSPCIQRAGERARSARGGGQPGDKAQQPKSSRVRAAVMCCLHVTWKLFLSAVPNEGRLAPAPAPLGSCYQLVVRWWLLSPGPVAAPHGCAECGSTTRESAGQSSTPGVRHEETAPPLPHTWHTLECNRVPLECQQD